MLEKEFLKGVIYNINSYVYIWYLVASWACEVHSLCEDFSDLASTTSNQYI